MQNFVSLFFLYTKSSILIIFPFCHKTQTVNGIDSRYLACCVDEHSFHLANFTDFSGFFFVVLHNLAELSYQATTSLI